MSSKQIIKILESDGWFLFTIHGDHYHFKHPDKSGKVTVPHPRKDVPKGTLNSILKQAGLR